MQRPGVCSDNEMEQAGLLIKEYEHMFSGPDDKVGFTDVTGMTLIWAIISLSSVT